MGLYQDMMIHMEQMGFDVTWIEDCQVQGNPYNKKDIGRHTKSVDNYNHEVDVLWNQIFDRLEGSYDYFLAIDGLMVSPGFFQKLKSQYPNIVSILYLYDRVKDNYELNVFFKHYDRILTFDRLDSQQYGIIHLPYYWIPCSDETAIQNDIFAMASYKAGERYEVFSKVRQIALDAGLRVNIHLWHPNINNPPLYQIKYYIKKCIGKKMLPLAKLKEEIFTDKKLSPDEFRHNIYSSKVILDTNNNYQEGLTPRFMWAIGAGKKIIMTNNYVKDYPFFNPEQIFLLKDNYQQIPDFIRKPFEMSTETKKILLPYRIDNWIKTLFDVYHEKCK